jgi:hypothetical protein
MRTYQNQGHYDEIIWADFLGKTYFKHIPLDCLSFLEYCGNL